MSAPDIDRLGTLWGHHVTGAVATFEIYRTINVVVVSGDSGEYMTTELSLSELIGAVSDWFELQSAWLVLSRDRSPAGDKAGLALKRAG